MVAIAFHSLFIAFTAIFNLHQAPKWLLFNRSDLIAIVYISLLGLLGILGVSGLVSGFLAVAVFAAASHVSQTFINYRYFILIPATLMLSLNLVPGIEKVQADNAGELITQNIYFNTGKAVAAVLLAVYVVKRFYWQLSIGILGAVLIPLCIISMALLLGTPLDTKTPIQIFAFALPNLFVTCFAEEIFFRKLVQDGLEEGLWRIRRAGAVSAICTSIIFCIAHPFWLSDSSALFASLFVASSFCYSLIYYFSKRIEYAIACHFFLNILHFLLLPYPFF